MTSKAIHSCWIWLAGCLWVMGNFSTLSVYGQGVPVGDLRFEQDLKLLNSLDLGNIYNSGSSYSPPPQNSPRVRLFQMPTGFISQPFGIEQDAEEEELARQAQPASFCSSSGVDDLLNRMQVLMGMNNPFFDLQRAGDPGGVGYFKMYSQLQVFDTGQSGCALSLQAVTPAGIQFGGIPDGAGPTVISPSVAMFHSLQDGTCVQGFFGQYLLANNDWGDSLHRGWQYGMAVQRPLIQSRESGTEGLYLFVEALGRYRPNTINGGNQDIWELLPGLHYRVSDAWWVSGGWIVPLGPTRPDAGMWHITCSWAF